MDLKPDEVKRRIEDAANIVQVSELLERLPSQLSGGQQQRVALARALVKKPQLLLLDEPLSNLDASLRLTMRTEIKHLQRRFGLTTILVTHDQVEATTMADRIICMSQGRIEQVGSPEDLYLRPSSLFVATFIGAPPINVFDAGAADGKLTVGETLFETEGAVASGPVKLGIRPEHFRFAGNGIEGRIDQIEPMGRETLHVVDTPLGAVRVLDPSIDISLAIGSQVHLAFDETSPLLFDGETGRLISDVRTRLANSG